jgi:signal transduction histidine kinase
MKVHSIIRDATVIVLAVEFICGIVLCGTAILHERHARLHELDEMVRGSADSLTGAVQDAEDPEDHVTVNPNEFRPRRGDLYAAYSPGRRLIGASEDAAKLLAPQAEDGFSELRFNGRNYRVYQRQALRIIDRYETGGAGLQRPFTVIYAMPMDHIWHEIYGAAQFYILLSATLLCLTAVLIVVLLRRLLCPLDELATVASAIDARSLNFEAPGSSLRIRELRPVAEAIAQTMTRLKCVFELQRRFISDAAHELKTAVAVVRSSVQVLSLRDRSPEQYQTGLDRILDDNSRVEELAARMLTLARFEEAATAISSCSIEEQIQIVLHRLEGFANLRSIRFRASCDRPGVVRISAEAAQILVSNLVMNAIQHSGQNSEVIVRTSASNPGQTLLEVQDFGSGIASENLPHVFERFFREDSSRSRETGGAGLGLAICKSIADGAGGEIRMQSTQGVGTCVTVLLPAE